MTPNLPPVDRPTGWGAVRRTVAVVATCAAVVAVVPLASARTEATVASVRPVASVTAVNTSAAVTTVREARTAGRALRAAGTQTTQAVPAATPAGKPVRRAADVACSLVGSLRLCSHGDDAAVAAGGEASSQQLSTASTRIGCYGDGRSGSRVQAVYARPVGAANRLGSYQSSFRGWAGALEKAVNDSAHQTGGARHIRFATTASGSGCVLDVRAVALPANAFTSFAATVSALQRQGLDAPNVKYLIWSEASGVCGMASAYEDSSPSKDNLNNGLYPTYARVDRKCWGYAETHELTHMLGGVQKGAPHATAGLHCRDGRDVMCYADGTAGSRQVSVCAAAQARLLDCRHDDYFSTAPPAGSWLATHWNIANSGFLAPGWTEPAAQAAPANAGAEPSGGTEPAPVNPSPTPSPTRSPLLPILP